MFGVPNHKCLHVHIEFPLKLKRDPLKESTKPKFLTEGMGGGFRGFRGYSQKADRLLVCLGTGQ